MAPVTRYRLRELESAMASDSLVIERAAAEFSRDDLIRSIQQARQSMRDAINALPASAFDPQPPNAAGDPVWSAGEIVSHICDAMLWLQFALARLAGDDPQGDPEDRPVSQVLERPATHELLERADRELALALLAAVGISDDARTPVGALGDLGVRGLLLLHAMHEWNHAEQLADLLHAG